MTEHILNFAIALDDEAIIKSVQEAAKKKILNDIKIEILNEIFAARYYGDSPVSVNSSGDVSVSRYAEFKDWAKDIIKDAFEEHKDEIIDRAADKIAERYIKTKAFKEKVDSKLDGDK